MAPGMSMSKLPDAEGMEMRMSRRGWPLKDAFAAATTRATKGGGSGSVSLELCLEKRFLGGLLRR